MKINKIHFINFIAFAIITFSSCTQTSKLTSIDNLNIDSAYKIALIDRTQKIIAPLNLKSNLNTQKVQNILINQYVIINETHKKFDDQINNLKSLNSEQKNELIEQQKNEKQIALEKNKKAFITALEKYLNEKQIDQIKDGMTYGVVPKTWAAYLDMLPNLTQVQKDQMYSWLIEARELAISESTSDKKHAMFGKYKGRINNFLSKEGYDMKKESKDWEARIKQKEQNKTQNNL
jgi:hypothetical protein